MSVSFEARFPGRCGVCDERFNADERVTYIDDEIAHASCPTPVVLADPCGRCYMIPATNGVCGCDE